MRPLLKTLTPILLALIGLAMLALLVGPLIVPIPPIQGVVPPQQLADPDSRFVEINGMDVHYKTAGQGEPALILLHGFGASIFSWREVYFPLSADHRVLAYDRPAFGLTERPTEWSGESPYSTQAQVNLLYDLMDAQGISQAVLVGNSAGGTVAMLAALDEARAAGRILALILVDPAVYTGGGTPSWIRPLFDTPQMRRVGPLLARNISSAGLDILNTAFHDPSKITPDIVAGYTKPLKAENWDIGLWELTRSSRPSGLAERLEDFRLPILVITGDDDRIVPTAESIRLAGELPDAELVVIPACGHVPQEECPAEFLLAVEQFLASLNP
jgi:pimeloyl-ACP methyl ester carboxylesterase